MLIPTDEPWSRTNTGRHMLCYWSSFCRFLFSLHDSLLIFARWRRWHHTHKASSSIVIIVLFCSLAVLDPRVGHTMDVLSLFVPVLCHSAWLFRGESCYYYLSWNRELLTCSVQCVNVYIFCRSRTGVPRLPVRRGAASHLSSLVHSLFSDAVLCRTRQSGTIHVYFWIGQ